MRVTFSGKKATAALTSIFGPSLVITSDGGYAVSGYSMSGISGNKTTEATPDGRWDVWLLRLDPAGNKLWERSFGEPGYDVPLGVHLAPDGGIYQAIMTPTPSGPWVRLIRLDGSGNQLWEATYTNRNISASCSALDSDMGMVVAGYRRPSPDLDFEVMKLSPDPLLLMPYLRILSSEARLRLKGMLGKTYLTERTGNFRNWFPVSTNTLSTAEIEIVDPTSAPKRFYRASMMP